MEHRLRIRVQYPDVDGNWQCIHVKPIEDRAEEYFVATVQPDLVMSGTSMKPGYMFDNRLVEVKLAPYCGDNALGEAIYCAINEGNERHGCYFIDRRDNERGHRAVCVEWNFAHVVTTDQDLHDAISGVWAVPDEPPQIPWPPPGFTARKLDNDRWEVRRKPREIVATVENEALARAVTALVSRQAVVAINVHGGLVHDVTIPPGLDAYLNVLVVDWDIEEPNTDFVEGGLNVQTEDGEAIAAVSEPSLRYPTGAADVDRAVETYFANRRGENT